MTARRSDRVAALVARLRMHATFDRARARELAIEIVQTETSPRALESALAELQSEPPDESRIPLRALYDRLEKAGLRLDVDCSFRTAIVEILRALDSRADADIAERAIRTIQPIPPSMIDVAQPLRANGLLLLVREDAERALYRAAELLTDPHVSRFSGEPAATAIRVLAAQRNLAPIWGLARRPGLAPEALAAAIEALRGMPRDLLGELLRDHLDSLRADPGAGDAVLLVLGDAIIGGRFAQFYERLVDLIEAVANPPLCAYLTGAVVRAEDRALTTTFEHLRRHPDPASAAEVARALDEARRARR